MVKVKELTSDNGTVSVKEIALNGDVCNILADTCLIINMLIEKISLASQLPEEYVKSALCEVYLKEE